MEVVLHLGVHDTHQDLLLRSLGANEALLSQAGVRLLHSAQISDPLLALLNGTSDALTVAHRALDPHLSDPSVRRLVIFVPHVLGYGRGALTTAQVYPNAAERLHRIGTLFSGVALTLTLGLRAPSHFLPDVAAALQRFAPGTDIAMGDPMLLSWAGLVERIRRALPDADLTVWRDEDAPLLWPVLLRHLAGLAASAPLAGDGTLARSLVPGRARGAFDAELAGLTGVPFAQWQAAVSAFLPDHADMALVEPEIPHPGWDARLIAALEAGYRADTARIRMIAGVNALYD